MSWIETGRIAGVFQSAAGQQYDVWHFVVGMIKRPSLR